MSARSQITVSARPGPVEIDPSRTAVLVIDMQNDFGSPGGMVDRAGIDLSLLREAIAPTARVLAAARRRDIPAVYTKMAHRRDLSDAGPRHGPHRVKHRPFDLGAHVATPDGGQGQILIEGTWNTEIIDEVAPTRGDVVVPKHRFSGFYRTELETVLETLSVNSLIVVGWTTSICVESTVRDAMFRDYTCLTLEDCTAEPVGTDLPRTNHEASLTMLELFGWVTNSDEIEQALA